MHQYSHSQSLGHLTGLAGRLFNNLLTRRFSEAGIDMTAEQWGVVLLLLHNEALTQGQIGEQLYLEKSTVSRSISGLEKRGWIVIKKDDKDARQKRISLSKQAVGIAERCYAIASGVLSDAQQGLSPSELSTGLTQLDKVIGNLRQLNR